MNNNILGSIIRSKKSCLIIPHQSPDGDCLGSSFALSNFLTRNNCEHEIVIDDVIPTNYLFLKTNKMKTSDEVLAFDKHYDYIIILDTSSLDRVGAKPEVLELASHTVVIDHHKTNLYFGDTNIVEMVSSVGELLFTLFKSCDYILDHQDAIGLYTSIVTDTGEFRYSNTTAETLEVVSELFKTGFDFESVSREIYSNQPLKKVKLKSKSLADMQIFSNGKIAAMDITQEMLTNLHCDMFHSDGIVEAGRDIEGVEVSVLFKEIDSDTVKASLRSKSYVDVSAISLVFNGGGHARAAGCTINKPLAVAKELLISLLKEKI